MKTIKMHCKSISQIQSGAYFRLKVISVVERHIMLAIYHKMSELLDIS